MRAALTHLQRLLITLGRPALYTIVFISYSIFLIGQHLVHQIKNLISQFPNFPISQQKELTSKLKNLTRNSQLETRNFIYIRPHFPFKQLFLFLFLDLIISSFIVICFYIYTFIFYQLPDPDLLVDQYQPPATTRIFDRHHHLLYQIYDSQNRIPIPLDTLPPHLINAHIAIEDANFFNHSGISLRDTFRALRHNLTYFQCQMSDVRCQMSLQGGSTITQQLVKNTLLTSQRSLQRKLREIVLAYQIESRLTKHQILEKYLNQVSYGGTAYGIEAAARTYFGKSATQLNLAESALLAGLPAAPSAYSPFGAHPERAQDRQRAVLRRMLADGHINHQQFFDATNQPLTYQTPHTNILAPHFVMYTRNHLEKLHGPQLISQGGLQITTSLDLEIQNYAQQTLTTQLSQLKNLHVTEGAILVTKPATGEILAMVGSHNYFDTANLGNVNATTALRQPGSSIKPINYATALSLTLDPSPSPLNPRYTAASIILDAPVKYNLPNQPPYTPINYDGKFHGPVTIRNALASSYNIPAVKILNSYGIDRMISMGQNLGITTWNDPTRFGLSLTLGGGDVTMTDMAVAYGTFANLGTRVPLNPIISITNPYGHDLNYPITQLPNHQQPMTNDLVTNDNSVTNDPSPVLDPRVAFLINHILADSPARASAFGRYSKLEISGHSVSVKTGTSNNLRDNWTIGYTPDYLVAVWVGNFDNSPMSRIASGITGAAPLWNQVMSYLLNEYESTTDNSQLTTINDHLMTNDLMTNDYLMTNDQFPWSPPPGLISIPICPYTGTLPCSGCPPKSEWFISGTQPTRACANFIPSPHDTPPGASPTPAPPSTINNPQVITLNNPTSPPSQNRPTKKPKRNNKNQNNN